MAITFTDDPAATIAKITLPDGSQYSIKDAAARAAINTLATDLTGSLMWRGVTSTGLKDGDTTSPVQLASGSLTPQAGDVVLVQNDSVNTGKEFVWDGARWQEIGDLADLKKLLGDLGLLAYADTASADYTPAGTVTGDFSGTEINLSAAYTPAGEVTIDSYTPEGGVTIDSYQPAGTVAAPTITVTPATGTISEITGVGTLPSATMPTLSTTVANENLAFSWTDGTFSAGTLPTMSDAAVVTGITSASATAPAFTGTSAILSATFSGTAKAPTGSFSGTAGVATSTFTPAGTLSNLSFAGTSSHITVSPDAKA